MFHLLTSQISFRKNSTNPFKNNSHKVDLTEKHFKLEYDKKEWETFVTYTFKVANEKSDSPDGPSLLTKCDRI